MNKNTSFFDSITGKIIRYILIIPGAFLASAIASMCAKGFQAMDPVAFSTISMKLPTVIGAALP